MPTIIDIYPSCRKPRWVKVGAECECNGEGVGNVFKIVALRRNAAMLENGRGYLHGWESFKNLHRVTRGEDD